MKRFRVTVEITPNEGPPSVEVYDLDPRNCRLDMASLGADGYPSRFADLGYDWGRILRARGHLMIRGLVLAWDGVGPGLAAYVAGAFMAVRSDGIRITWEQIAQRLTEEKYGNFDPDALRIAADEFARAAFAPDLLARWEKMNEE